MNHLPRVSGSVKWQVEKLTGVWFHRTVTIDELSMLGVHESCQTAIAVIKWSGRVAAINLRLRLRFVSILAAVNNSSGLTALCFGPASIKEEWNARA